MAKKNLSPSVDVICTEFVLNTKGYKEKTGEHPMRFSAKDWEIIRTKTYPSREFRLAAAPEIDGFEVATEITKEDEMRIRIAELEAILRNQNRPKVEMAFTPKSRSELTVMNKEQLIAYNVAKHGTDPELYKDMLKRELVTEAEK